MKRISLTRICGALLTCLGFIVMIGWYIHSTTLISLRPTYPHMVFNAALTFVLCGVTLLLSNAYEQKQNLIYTVAGILILIFSGATLSQTEFHYSLGIDQFFVNVWRLDQNPYPGRLADNTAIGFILASMVFILLPHTKIRWIAATTQFFIFLISLIGASGLIGYALNLEFLYSWLNYNRMSMYATVMFIILGIGLLNAWRNNKSYRSFYSRREDMKILMISVITLFYTAAIAGLLGFVVSAEQNKKVIAESQQQLLQDKTSWLQESMQQAFFEMQNLLKSPLINDALTANTKNERFNKEISTILVDTSFAYFEIFDNKNNSQLSSGTSTTPSNNVLSIQQYPYKSRLFEKDGIIIFQIEQPIISHGEQLGTLLAEWRFAAFDAVFITPKIKSNESYFICSINNIKKIICIPSINSAEDILSLGGNNQLEGLIQHNQQGYLTGTDYLNKQVMVSYRPTEIANIGIIIKKDLAAIYAPLLNQLSLIIPIVLFIIIIGSLILYQNILPLIRDVIRSKKYVSDMNIRLDSIINNIDEGIIVTNELGTIEEFNPKSTEIFGYMNEEMIGRNINVIIPGIFGMATEHDATKTQSSLIKDSYLIGKGSEEMQACSDKGRSIPIELSLTEMTVENKRYYVGIARDMTLRKLADAKLKESEEKFRLSFNSSSIGMAIIAIDGHFIQVNTALCDILGYAPDELLNSNFQSIIVSQDLRNAVKMRNELLDDTLKHFQIEERYHHKDGNTVWLLLSHSLVRSETHDPLYFIVQIQDITEKKKSHEQLAYQAFFDPLTGLPNRVQLEHDLNNIIHHAKRYHHKFAVFFLDLDKFKIINDTFGHDMGDKVLITVAERLMNSVRKTDIVSRLSGDEFIIVMTETPSIEVVAELAQKIVTSIAQPIKINENSFSISASIGISLYPANGNNYQVLLKNADLALYKAKEYGRNTYLFCTHETVDT